MRPLTHVLETVLYADDLDAAEAFYRDRLGLEVDSRKPGLFSFLRIGDAMLLLFRPAASRENREVPPHGATGSGHVCFAVPEAELDSWKQRLVADGVAVEYEQAWPRGGRSFYVRDPAGNSVEFATPRIWGMPERFPQ
jgi:catechol 2,3-dioxygenase-like lactoylglutathione lyase family enzyme